MLPRPRSIENPNQLFDWIESIKDLVSGDITDDISALEEAMEDRVEEIEEADAAIDANTAAIARVDPGENGTDGKVLGWESGAPVWIDPPSISPISGASRPTIAALGDSITSNGVYDGGAGDRNWLMHACVASGGILQWVDNVGTGGAKTAEILSTDLPVLLTLDPKPGYVAVLAGPNDTGVTSYGDFIEDYATILDTLRGEGIIPVACEILPNNTSDKWADIATFNAGIRSAAQSRNVPIINWHDALADADGSWKDTLPTAGDDGVHPEAETARVMGNLLWLTLSPYLPVTFPWSPALAATNDDEDNLFPNALFATDSNADGLANGLNLTGSLDDVTVSLVPATDGVTLGNWQRLTLDVGSTGGGQLYSDEMTGMAAGDVLALSFRFAAHIVSGNTGQIGFIPDLNTISAIGFVDGAEGSRGRHWINHWASDVSPMTVYQELTVRSEMESGARLIFNMGGSVGDGSWMQIAQVTVRNL